MLFIDRQGDAALGALDGLERSDSVQRLERTLEAAFSRRAVTVCSADAAIHTALDLSGVSAGDYVFVPSYTFYSYVGSVADFAVPVFIDCDPITRCVAPSALEAAFVWAELQNKPPKAVIIDNAFGSAADFDALVPLCKAWNVRTVELALDALFGGDKTPSGCNCDIGVIGFGKRVAGGGAALLLGDADYPRALEFTRRAYSERESRDYRLHPAVAALDIATLGTAKRVQARSRANLTAIAEAVKNIAAPVRGDAGTYALCKIPVQTVRAAGFEAKQPPPVHTLPRYRGETYFEYEPGYSVSESFSEYCLVDMDMSFFMRMKLIGLLN